MEEQPSTSVSEILREQAQEAIDAIDNGLMFNTIPVPSQASVGCWRCNKAPAKTSIGLCVPCRDWLHEDDHYITDEQLNQHPQYGTIPHF